MLDVNSVLNDINQIWHDSIISVLQGYIAIPCKSPLFDKNWEKAGYLEQAAQLLVRWCEQQALTGAQITIQRLPNRTPLIYVEIAGQQDETILLYGHYDKQPEMTGWDDDKGPWKPVLQDDKLYGRGGADDGYAIFSALSAIKALQQQNVAHPRCVILIEGCEESGSYDLPIYIEYLAKKIGQPKLVVCLDSGAGNYEQLWLTTSLRGVIAATLSVDILTQGMHSGLASGVVPCSFRILRQLLSRIEDEKTGEILLKAMHVEIPQSQLSENKAIAKELGENVWQDFPFVAGAKPVTEDIEALMLNQSWRPSLVVTGIDGVPPVKQAGNVLRPMTKVTLSFRLPPTCDSQQACEALKKALTHDSPYHAKIDLEIMTATNGWQAPKIESWLASSVQEASKAFFGKPALYWGEGGSIPFMNMLAQKFPQAQFMITGVLGPHANAHGPNEFLHIPTAKKVTACIASVIAKSFGALDKFQ